MACLEPTYEGLKQLAFLVGRRATLFSLEPTYEGLKLRNASRSPFRAMCVWSLPMRD